IFSGRHGGRSTDKTRFLRRCHFHGSGAERPAAESSFAGKPSRECHRRLREVVGRRFVRPATKQSSRGRTYAVGTHAPDEELRPNRGGSAEILVCDVV